MKKLPAGITGFLDDLSQKRQAVSFTEFKSDMHEVARKVNAKVVDCCPINTCENYFSCEIKLGSDTIFIMCNTIYPVIGLCSSSNPNEIPRKFVTSEMLEQNIEEVRNYEVMTPKFLKSKVESSHISELNVSELSEINHC